MEAIFSKSGPNLQAPSLRRQVWRQSLTEYVELRTFLSRLDTLGSPEANFFKCATPMTFAVQKALARSNPECAGTADLTQQGHQ